MELAEAAAEEGAVVVPLLRGWLGANGAAAQALYDAGAMYTGPSPLATSQVGAHALHSLGCASGLRVFQCSASLMNAWPGLTLKLGNTSEGLLSALHARVSLQGGVVMSPTDSA